MNSRKIKLKMPNPINNFSTLKDLFTPISLEANQAKKMNKIITKTDRLNQ